MSPRNSKESQEHDRPTTLYVNVEGQLKHDIRALAKAEERSMARTVARLLRLGLDTHRAQTDEGRSHASSDPR